MFHFHLGVSTVSVQQALTLVVINMEKHETKVLAWSVQAICFSRRFSKPKKTRQRQPSAKGKIIVYRAYFLKLLNFPKPLRDQLIIELPTLNGFRTREVATVQREHVDLEKGDIQVLDSKKHVFSTLPMGYMVWQHFEDFFIETHITSGLAFTPTPRAGRRHEGHMTDQAIEYIWRKYCKLADVPYMPPRLGRAYLAVTLLERMNLIDVMDMLRHTEPKVTLRYISKIRDYAFFKAKFHRATESPFVSECARSDSCPLATEGCRCRMFTPRLEVEAK